MPRNARLQDAIEDFHRTREGDGKRLQTRKNDKHCLSRLLLEVGNIQVRNVEERHIDRFFAAVGSGEKALSPATLNLFVFVLNVFWDHCARHGFIARDANPMGTKNRIRKVPPTPRLFIPVDRFDELLDAAHDPRDRMFIALGLYLFVRQGEMLTLKWGDVDFTNREVFIRIHKTDEIDTMPMSEELEQEFRRYKTWYTEQVGVIDNEYFVVPKRQIAWKKNEKGHIVVDGESLVPTKPATRVYDHVKRAMAELGLPTHQQGGHTLRRSGARARFDAMVEMGYDGALQHVRAMLHHASATMTEHYLGINIERKKRDDMIKGQPMFPSIRRTDAVVDLFKRDVKDGTEG